MRNKITHPQTSILHYKTLCCKIIIGLFPHTPLQISDRVPFPSGGKLKKTQKKLEITRFLTKIPTMKFILIDRVTELDPGKQLTAVKSVSLAEEYLGDHFPAFPVLPGVLLLEGLIESASWLVRHQQDFANSMVLLETAKNVKYKSFAAPGMQIQYTVMATAIEDNASSFKGVGVCGDEPIVEAKLALRHFNLGDDNPKLAHVDGTVIENLKQRWKLLYSE